jgi:hypothetical protein
MGKEVYTNIDVGNTVQDAVRSSALGFAYSFIITDL